MANILHQLEKEEDDALLAWLRSEIERLRLTDAEREAVKSCIGDYEQNDDDADCARMVATLRGLLERLG